jgi:hypothetical protein
MDLGLGLHLVFCPGAHYPLPLTIRMEWQQDRIHWRQKTTHQCTTHRSQMQKRLAQVVWDLQKWWSTDEWIHKMWSSIQWNYSVTRWKGGLKTCYLPHGWTLKALY